MNKADSQFQDSAVMSGQALAEPDGLITSRLVVVMLEPDEEATLAGRILMLAGKDCRNVLLVGVCPDALRQTELRRRLVTIAAFLREQTLPGTTRTARSEEELCVEVRIEHGKDWIQRIRMTLQPGDTLACYEGQEAAKPRRQLCDILSSNLESPIYVFSQLTPPQSSHRTLLSQATSWLGSLAGIGTFFLLQVRIVTVIQGGTQTVLLILTLFAEVSVIWIWNSLFT